MLRNFYILQQYCLYDLCFVSDIGVIIYVNIFVLVCPVTLSVDPYNQRFRDILALVFPQVETTVLWNFKS